MVVGTIVGLVGTVVIGWFSNRQRKSNEAGGGGTALPTLLLTLAITIGLILLIYLGVNVYLNLNDLEFKDLLGQGGQRFLEALEGQRTRNNPEGLGGIRGLAREYIVPANFKRTALAGTTFGGWLSAWANKRNTRKGFVTP